MQPWWICQCVLAVEAIIYSFPVQYYDSIIYSWSDGLLWNDKGHIVFNPLHSGLIIWSWLCYLWMMWYPWDCVTCSHLDDDNNGFIYKALFQQNAFIVRPAHHRMALWSVHQHVLLWCAHLWVMLWSCDLISSG